MRAKRPAPSIRRRQVSPAYGGQMTAVKDKAGETGIDMAEATCREAANASGRDAITREVCRGVGRLLRALGFAVINELSLANGRRADVVGRPESPPVAVALDVLVEQAGVDRSGRQRHAPAASPR